MSKLLVAVVNGCYECPHYKLRTCTLVRRDVDRWGSYPDWCPLPDTQHETSEVAAARVAQDDAILSYLDNNQKMRMGWNAGIAPAGNISLRSIIVAGKGTIPTFRDTVLDIMPDETPAVPKEIRCPECGAKFGESATTLREQRIAVDALWSHCCQSNDASVQS